MNRFLPILLLWLICTATLAQTTQPTIITVDTTTGVPMTPLPFHRPFFLKMAARNANPIKVVLFEHVRNKTLVNTLFRKTIKTVSTQTPDGTPRIDSVFTTFYPLTLDPSYFFTKKEGTKLNLYINFRDEFALKPSRQYSIAVYYGATPGSRDVFNLLHEASNLGDGKDPAIRRKRAKKISGAIDKYASIATAASLGGEAFFGMSPLDYPDSSQLNKTKIDSINISGIIKPTYAWVPSKDKSGVQKMKSTPEAINEVEKLFSYYEKTVRPKLLGLEKQTTRLDSAVTAQTTPPLTLPPSAPFDSLLTLYTRLDAQKESKIRELYSEDSQRILRVLQGLKGLPVPTLEQIRRGLRPLLCDFCELTKITDYPTRIKNLEATIGDANKTRLLAQLYTNRVNVTNVDVYLDKLTAQLIANRLILQEINKAEEAVTKAIAGSNQFNTADLTSTNTFIFSFETRTKYSLVPEVGILTNRVFRSGQGSNFLLVPYIGATVNFSQLDRDVPFYTIRNKTFWTRTGLVLGMTLVSLKDTTGTTPRDDFFEKASLVTGLSFRFSNTVKAVYGYNWYYNRSRETGVRSLTSMPFIGLSFDIDVQKYVSGLFGAVTSLKGVPDKKPIIQTP